MAILNNLNIQGNQELRLPSGTSSERPSNPNAGMIRYNTDLQYIEFYNGESSEWQSIERTNLEAIGGKIFDITINAVSYRIHAWYDPGTYTMEVEKGGSMDVLVVGGGGGGGGSGGGGGGAGGLVLDTIEVTPGTYTIQVGSPGQGGVGQSTAATNGGDSSAFGYTATGGGHGGTRGIDAGSSGGSGGGGNKQSQTTGGSGLQPGTNPGALLDLGNDGGDGLNYGGYGAAGGGGGSVEPGQDQKRIAFPGDGGDGVNLSSLFGSALGNCGAFAAGGGSNMERELDADDGYGDFHSGGIIRRTGNDSEGGVGGGGDAEVYYGTGYDADYGTGSGGGGGVQTNAPESTGGDGSPGVVLVRYTKNLSDTRVPDRTIQYERIFTPRNNLFVHMDAAHAISYPGSGNTWYNIGGIRQNGHGTLTGVNFINENYGVMSFGPNTRVDVPNFTNLNPTKAVTVNVWVKIEGTANSRYQVLAGKGTADLHSDGYGLWLWRQGLGENGVSIRVDGKTVNSNIDTSNLIGKWTMITGTYNGDNGELQIIYDGKVINTASRSSGDIPRTSGAFTIGEDNTSTDRYVNGKIGLVQVWARPLFIEEIQQIFEDTRGRYGI